MIKFLKENIYQIILFFLIYTSNDTVVFGTNSSPSIFYIKYILLFLINGFLVFKKGLSNNILSYIFILLLCFILSFIVSPTGFGFIYILLLFLTALLYAHIVTFPKFCEYFNKMVYIFAIFSLVFYILNLFIPSTLDAFPTITNAADLTFKNCILSVVPEILATRNFGIFREPGVFICYLNIAIFFELFFLDKRYLSKRLIIYIITILTTISTAGYIVFALIIVSYIFSRRKISLLPFVLLGLLGFAIYYISNSEMIITLLFHKITNETGSYIARVSSITVPLKMISINPFGVGPEQYNILFPILSSNLYGVSVEPEVSTNTMLKFCSVYGIQTFIFILIGLLKLIKKVSKQFIVRVSFFIVILLLSSNEDLRESIMFYLLLAYGFINKRKLNYHYENFKC